ncbi:MAG: IclR family transcriptional regulator [Streptosporangiaceae bacterium]|nr:IclR family transcriptional regulator [Streptosporangiaceae bacterium]
MLTGSPETATRSGRGACDLTGPSGLRRVPRVPRRPAQVARSSSERNSTADRAIDVLLLFAENNPIVSAVQVAERLGMSRSTTYRYLQSLRSAGLLEDDAGGFRLGPRILQLANVARKGLGLSDVARPVMAVLAAEVDEAVLLTRRFGDQVVCVERKESSHPVRLSYELGHVMPVHAGASAKVVIAWTDDDEIRAILGDKPLARLTAATVTDPARLRRELAGIRERGYAISRGEVDRDVIGIAAPVWGEEGEVVAGLTIAAPAYRVPDPLVGTLTAAVLGAAAQISRRLGHLT